MPYASWPSTLPQFVLESGFSEGEPDQLLVTAMEAGKPKSRRRYTTAGSTYAAAVAMTAAQKVIFKDFFRDTLQGGALPFAWVDPVTQAPMNFMFRKPVPKWSVRGNAHIVAFALEEVV